MLNNIFILVLTAFTICVTFTHAQLQDARVILIEGENLLQDSSFELNDGSWESTGKGKFEIDNNEYRTGSLSMMTAGVGIEDGDWSGGIQSIDLPDPDAPVLVRGWGQMSNNLVDETTSNNGAEFGLLVTVTPVDARFPAQSFSSRVSRSESWDWFSFEPVNIVPTMALKSVSLACVIRKASEDAIGWCDDLSVVQMSPPEYIEEISMNASMYESVDESSTDFASIQTTSTAEEQATENVTEADETLDTPLCSCGEWSGWSQICEVGNSNITNPDGSVCGLGVTTRHKTCTGDSCASNTVITYTACEVLCSTPAESIEDSVNIPEEESHSKVALIVAIAVGAIALVLLIVLIMASLRRTCVRHFEMSRSVDDVRDAENANKGASSTWNLTPQSMSELLSAATIQALGALTNQEDDKRKGQINVLGSESDCISVESGPLGSKVDFWRQELAGRGRGHLDTSIIDISELVTIPNATVVTNSARINGNTTEDIKE
eukprot:CFRG2972T1